MRLPVRPVLVLLAALAACEASVTPDNPFDPSSTDPRDGRLEGRIAGEEGRAVANARVSLRAAGQATPTTITPGEDGAFAQDIAPGDYTLGVTAPGFESADVPGVRVAPGLTTDIGRIVLRVARGTLEGAVRLANGASPEGTFVSFLPQDGQPAPPALVVGATGTYASAGVATGRYLVRASKPEFVPAYSEPVTVVAASTLAVPELQLSDGSAVVSRKVDDGGDPRWVGTRGITLVLATFGELFRKMRVSEDPTFRDAAAGDTAYRDYEVETAFTLADRDGDHVVFATFQDRYGLETPPYRLALVLDRVKPEVVEARVGDGSAFVRERTGETTAAVHVSDDRTGVAAVRFAVDADIDDATWSPVETTRLEARLPAIALALGTTRGAHEASFQVRDRAGNESPVRKISVFLDASAPVAGSATPVTLADGSLTARATDVVLVLAVEGDADDEVLAYAAANGDAVPETATWSALGPTRAIPFTMEPDLDGAHPVTVRVRDAAGNVSEPLQATIALDRTGALAGRITLRGQAGSVAGVTVTLTNLVDSTFTKTVAAAADGRFTFERIPAAKAYVLAIAREGYRTQSVQGIEVVAGRSLSIPDVALEIAKGSLRGTVVLADRGVGESGGISVYATQTPYAAVTSPTGDFSLELPVGTYEIAARATGYLAGSFGASIAVVADASKDLGRLDLRKQSGQFAICRGTDASCTQGAIDFTASRSVRLKLDSTSATHWRAGLTNPPAGAYTALGSATTHAFEILQAASPNDGVKTIYVQYKAPNGDELTPLSATVTLDTTAPTLAGAWLDREGSGGSALFTSDVAGKVTLTLDASDSGSGLATVTVSNEDTTFDEQPGAFATQLTHFLQTSVDGPKNVYVRLCDRVANCTAAPSTPSAKITLDRVAPSKASGADLKVASVSGGTITDDAAVTANASVRVKISAGDAVAVRFGATEALAGATWNTLTPGTTSYFEYALTAGDGTKTVYAQFQDAAGNTSSTSPNPFSDAIVLDQTAPTGLSIAITGTPGQAPANGYTNAASVPVTLAAMGATQMEVVLGTSEAFTGAWETYATSKSLAFATGAADRTYGIFARFRDAAGNVSSTATTTIVRDTAAPAAGPTGGGAAVSIRQDATGFITSTGVNIALNVTGADEMSIACSGSGSTSGFIAYLVAWACSATTPGTQTVTATFRDRAGNTYAPGAASVTYDATGPDKATGLQPATGTITRTQPTLSWTAPAATDLSHYLVEISADATFGTLDFTSAALTTTSVSAKTPSDGTFWWRVTAYDRAGNKGTASTASSFTLDGVAPGLATISAAAAGETGATLTFNAPGDDGDANSLGAGSRYEIGYALENSSRALAWETATKVTVTSPKGFRQPESVAVTGLTRQKTYCFALKVTDDAGNTSGDPTTCHARLAMPDLTLPTKVGPLAVSTRTNLFEASWAHVLDDDERGAGEQPAGYTLYASVDPLVDARDFELAKKFNVPVPAPAPEKGAKITFNLLHTNGSLTFTTNQTYTFAVRAYDEAGNQGEIPEGAGIVRANYSVVANLRPKQPREGDWVELDGVNLGSVTGTVSFGGVLASEVAFWSPTLVRVRVPDIPRSAALSSAKLPVATVVGGLSSTSFDDYIAPGLYNVFPGEQLAGSPTYVEGTRMGAQLNGVIRLNKSSWYNQSQYPSSWSEDAITFATTTSEAPGVYNLRVANVNGESNGAQFRLWRSLPLPTSIAATSQPRAFAMSTAPAPTPATGKPRVPVMHLLSENAGTWTYVYGTESFSTPTSANLTPFGSLATSTIRSPAMTTDAAGNVWACFTTVAAGYQVYVARRAGSGTAGWSAPVQLYTAATGPFDPCRISTASKGTTTYALVTFGSYDFSTGNQWNGRAMYGLAKYTTGLAAVAVSAANATICPSPLSCGTTTIEGDVRVAGFDGVTTASAGLFHVALLQRKQSSAHLTGGGALWVGQISTDDLDAAATTNPFAGKTLTQVSAYSFDQELAPIRQYKQGSPSFGSALLWMEVDAGDGLTRSLRLTRVGDVLRQVSLGSDIEDVLRTVESPSSSVMAGLAVTRDGDISIAAQALEGPLVRHHLYRATDDDRLGEDANGLVLAGTDLYGGEIRGAGGSEGMVAFFAQKNGGTPQLLLTAVPSRGHASSVVPLLSAPAAGTVRYRPVVSVGRRSATVLYLEQTGTNATSLRALTHNVQTGTTTQHATPLASWTQTIRGGRDGYSGYSDLVALGSRAAGVGVAAFVVPKTDAAGTVTGWDLRFCGTVSTCTTPAVLYSTAAGAPTVGVPSAPTLAIGQDETVHVAYERQNVGSAGVRTIYYLAIKPTTNEVLKHVEVTAEEAGRGSSLGPGLAVDPAGAVHVFYRTKFGGDSLRVRSLSPGEAAFGPPTDLLRDTFPIERPSAAVSRRGIELAWVRNGSLFRATWRYGWVVPPEEAGTLAALPKVMTSVSDQIVIAGRAGSVEAGGAMGGGGCRFASADDVLNPWRNVVTWGETNPGSECDAALDPGSGELGVVYVGNDWSLSRVTYTTQAQ